jgi:RNA polymerase sigma factor for flagellar operon FliA
VQAVDIQSRWQDYLTNRDRDVRDQLIMQYAPLVKYVAGRMVVSLPGVINNEDILSYGTIGLIQAVDRFDPAQGVKFETYAIRRIRGSIIDAIRSLHPLSRDTNRRAREIEQAYDELIHGLGRTPEDREVADHLGLSLDEFRTQLMESSTTIVSLDTPLGDVGDEERTSLVDQIMDEDETDVSDQVERADLRRHLVKAIHHLPERDRTLISLYYYEELTLKEISEVLGVSTSRVSQLHAAAVFKLRSALRAAMAVAG